MRNHSSTIIADGVSVNTLEDILPSKPGLKILFIAKTPAPVSVEAGHYFQGKQGKMFWSKLKEYGILKVPSGEYEDDRLLAHGYGLTDIVKVPRGYGSEPSDEEYRVGADRIIELVKQHHPTVVVFVYKRVLDQLLKLSFHVRTKSVYGLNPTLNGYFGSEVFVFPMPGTPCRKEVGHEAMRQLAKAITRPKSKIAFQVVKGETMSTDEVKHVAEMFARMIFDNLKAGTTANPEHDTEPSKPE